MMRTTANMTWVNSTKSIKELTARVNKIINDYGARPVVQYFVYPGKPQTAAPTEEQIIHRVCEYFHITGNAIMSYYKPNLSVRARQVAMILMRVYLKISYKKIGFIFRYRDHTTAIHNIRKAIIFLETDPKFREDFFNISKNFYK